MAATTRGEDFLQKPDPPVVGKVSHQSIELYWDINSTLQRKGSTHDWLKFSIEEEDAKTHVYGTIYSGHSKQHVVEGLEPSAPYRFRLKVTGRNGEYEYSPVVSVSTTREPMSGEGLHRAVSMNDEARVIDILQKGHVKVDIPDELGFTPLMIAAQGGYLRFMLTCFAGHLDIVQYLRKQGASWECRDKGGCTAMHWAVDGGHLKVIQWLIDDGCKIDIKDTCLAWTPLMRVSAITGNTNVALCLIEAGADVNTKDADGKTPLMVATLNNHESLVRLLIEKGANCDIKTEYGITIPDMAKAFNRQNVLLIFEEMKRESL
ncbi:fibronectin type 3 and ankyrin repeat domains protein 1 isoform X3 [Ascaphus truei]|uniref:fibronectin type 3 and ankyrin repeat domains protein 1 isoform X3 n=1 Tax=Ascaphus truei TaxID=8439 RepID=UPI003F59B014